MYYIMLELYNYWKYSFYIEFKNITLHYIQTNISININYFGGYEYIGGDWTPFTLTLRCAHEWFAWLAYTQVTSAGRTTASRTQKVLLVKLSPLYYLLDILKSPD